MYKIIITEIYIRMEGWLMAIIIIGFLVCIAFVVATFYYTYEKKEEIKAQIKGLAENTLEMTPEEFFAMRKTSFGGRGRPSYALTQNFAGVYILFNSTKNMYYVGQGKEVLNRVNAHFTGKGNGDVYADYKYGDKFIIKMISLEKSGYSTLNELERNTIMTYNAFASGYNKTRGNR